MVWRITVTSADGTAKDTVNVDDAIASLTDFSVDAVGNCLEASFTAVPSQVDISARDIITLQVYESGAWVSYWRGFVTIAGNPRSDDLQEYRAVGLKQRFYERVLENAFVEGADVATMVTNTVYLTNLLPTGVVWCYPVTGDPVPPLTFELADRYPMLESFGAFLDFMAESVGAFIVPTGESYVYDGVTYSAGDTVPAVMWGVGADGCFLFRRPQASSVAVDEGDVTTRVTWNGINAEEYTNVVRLLYMSAWVDASGIGVDLTSYFNVPQGVMAWPLVAPPLERTFGAVGDAASTWAERLVALTNPLDYMTAIPVEVKSSTGFTNASNAVDGSDSTYAYFSGGGANNITIRPQSTSPVNGCLWRVRLASPSTGATWQFWAYALESRAGTGSGDYARVGYEMSSEDAAARSAATDLYIYIAEPAGWVGDPLQYAELFIHTSGSIDADTSERVYEVECYVPDVDAGEHASEALAEGFLRAVPPEVATVEVQGLGAVTQSLDLTPIEGAVLTDLRVERTSYRITVEDGVVTTYHVGQAFEPDLEAQRIVLERLARKANNNEPVSKPKRAS